MEKNRAESGYLYQKSTVEDTKYYELNISSGTYVSTILGIIDIIATKGTLTAIIRAIGYSITGASVDSIVFYGS